MKKEKKESIMTTMKELGIAVGVGQEILDELGELPELKGNFKKYYEEYEQSIKVDENTIPKEHIKQFKEDIEEELLAIECFLRWLQEDKKVKLE